jgi:alanyl-tRNA synthetase
VLVVSSADGKVNLVAGLSPDLVKQGLHAGNWLKEVAPIVGGGGGGRPDMAQAGGKNPEQIPAALDHALKTIRVKLEGGK